MEKFNEKVFVDKKEIEMREAKVFLPSHICKETKIPIFNNRKMPVVNYDDLDRQERYDLLGNY